MTAKRKEVSKATRFEGGPQGAATRGDVGSVERGLPHTQHAQLAQRELAPQLVVVALAQCQHRRAQRPIVAVAAADAPLLTIRITVSASAMPPMVGSYG
jgi:hypothetical protein